METLEESLRRYSFFDDLSDEQLAFVSGCGRNARFSSGQLIFREGAPADALYLVRSGMVTLEIHEAGRGTAQVETIDAGDVVGWSWLYPPHRWNVDARATGDVAAVVFDGTCLREKIERDHDLGYRLMKKLLYHLHVRLERVRLRHLDVYRSRSAP